MLRRIHSRRAACVIAAIAIATLGSAAPAFGTPDHYMVHKDLGPGNSYASASSNANPYYTESVSNHTVCPGFHVGNVGYFSGAPVDFKPLAACGPGTIGWNSPRSGTWRGATFNPNSVTVDTISDAHYSW